MTWRATVLTLFPGMFPGPLGHSLAGRALAQGLWSLDVRDIRDYAGGRGGRVDDAPFGGGAGMVMRPDVVSAALAGVQDGRPAIYLTPRGRRLTQPDVAGLAQGPGVILLCGRYEGVDQRALEACGVQEVSAGDYVLSGGEPAARVLLDASVRRVPGDAESGTEESFSSGLLEYPHYTRPAEWCGRAVPDVLLSGNHAAIRAWRQAQAEAVTRDRRPDLWAGYVQSLPPHAAAKPAARAAAP